MSRLPRLYIPGLPQLITQRGNNRSSVFADEADFQQYRQHLRESAREAGVALHAYVLMPDHAHLLITPPDEDAAGSLMQRLGRRYVRWFNDRHHRSGTLWEGRYRSTVVEPNEWLHAASRYIELNPVRAGLVASAEHYPWSSCRHHLGLEPDPLIADHALYWQLGNTPFERQAAWRRLLEAGISFAELDRLRYSAHRGWMLGQAPVTSLDPQPNRRLAPLPKGRPRKLPSA
ncbi:transposase [Uliginosibacterium sp. 31-16]|uniref:REP-associated tyrosine transposase n=1 Tax=Uliginosibacterium sp. 31-16 TaxID=3068315 RepID=UPI00273F515C|nr:transposase [Uliginosibacterium sp. 31-16]MDP5238607.1 transposase [Uliginosibacterium sp. 31-16]